MEINTKYKTSELRINQASVSLHFNCNFQTDQDHHGDEKKRERKVFEDLRLASNRKKTNMYFNHNNLFILSYKLYRFMKEDRYETISIEK